MKTVLIRKQNLCAKITTTGATVKSLLFHESEVGMDGIIVGRYANRISGGAFAIDGREYRLSQNEGRNTLHGGAEGFDQREWIIDKLTPDSVVLSLVSEDQDQGFPGKLRVEVKYTITEDNALKIEYSARTDAPTVVNLTNHLYFNLNSSGSASDHLIRIDADRITQTDSTLIPTGRLINVEGTRYDLRKLREFEPDFDDNFVLNSKGTGIAEAAELVGKDSGIRMKVFTDQPGFQLYNTAARICLETQHFADSPNRPEFPSTLLLPGETFRSTTIYAFEQGEPI